MNKSVLKSQEFEWITFDDFLKTIKDPTDEPCWSGRILDMPFTHENNSCYLIGYADKQVRFNRGEILCFLKDKTPFILNHPLIKFIESN